MTQRVHLIAGLTSTVLITVFLTSTVLVEVFGLPDAVARVKSLILLPGIVLLVPALMLTGATGFALARVRRGPLVDIKRKRMPVIAANGVLILIPCAIVLERWAAAGDFDMPFFIVQGIELAAGAVNLALMGLNMRDGFRLTGRITEHRPTSASFHQGR